MHEFVELDAAEHWSAELADPELKAAYQSIP
jgi:hypothetical protein